MRFIVKETQTVTMTWLIEAKSKDDALMRVQHKMGPGIVLTQLNDESYEMEFEVKEDDFSFEKKS